MVELAWLTESQQEVTFGSALPRDFNRQDELVISEGVNIHRIFGFLIKGSDLFKLRGIWEDEFLCEEI